MQLPQQQIQSEDKGPFPASEGEAKQFSNDILQVLYDDKTHDNIVRQVSNIGDAEKVEAVGMVAANIVGNRTGDVRAQTGRPIEMKLVVGAVQAVIGELAEIAENNGSFSMAPEERQGSLQSAITILDEMSKGGGQQLPQGGQNGL